jgi:hypothetical protein
MPNLHAYYESVTGELDALRNRIRDLINHNLTDGEWKEAALRTILRRYLPSTALVGRGFVVGRDQSSTQIDMLVLKAHKPTLFRDGDLVVVTPDVPGAIVEVKTRLVGARAWYGAAAKLARHGLICKDISGNFPWLGLFSYDGDDSQTEHILNAVCRAYRDTGIAINCATSGYDIFVRYWPPGHYEPGDDALIDGPRSFWRAYQLVRLAPSYFISNLVDSMTNIDRDETDHVWFAHQGGKGPFRIAERRREECEPNNRVVERNRPRA